MDGKIILLHPYHAGKLCSKFEHIPSSGLGGACMMNTDKWTEEMTTIFPPLKVGDYIGENKKSIINAVYLICPKSDIMIKLDIQ